jgi:hypothetical protein
MDYEQNSYNHITTTAKSNQKMLEELVTHGGLKELACVPVVEEFIIHVPYERDQLVGHSTNYYGTTNHYRKVQDTYERWCVRKTCSRCNRHLYEDFLNSGNDNLRYLLKNYKNDKLQFGPPNVRIETNDSNCEKALVFLKPSNGMRNAEICRAPKLTGLLMTLWNKSGGSSYWEYAIKGMFEAAQKLDLETGAEQNIKWTYVTKTIYPQNNNTPRYVPKQRQPTNCCCTIL